jgi:ribosomal protein S18 acetylase RimI-like enzyme
MSHRSYLLELVSPGDFRPKPFPRDDVALRRAPPGEAEAGRSLWTEVGRGFWTERSDWTLTEWRQYLEPPEVCFFIASIGREPVGFFELNLKGAQAKLEGFGLLPAWRNRGLGGGLLSVATQSAFALGATRIWLHTATDDHPHALSNYQARGYRIYHEEELRHPIA